MRSVLSSDHARNTTYGAVPGDCRFSYFLLLSLPEGSDTTLYGDIVDTPLLGHVAISRVFHGATLACYHANFAPFMPLEGGFGDKAVPLRHLHLIMEDEVAYPYGNRRSEEDGERQRRLYFSDRGVKNYAGCYDAWNRSDHYCNFDDAHGGILLLSNHATSQYGS